MFYSASERCSCIVESYILDSSFVKLPFCLLGSMGLGTLYGLLTWYQGLEINHYNNDYDDNDNDEMIVPGDGGCGVLDVRGRGVA